MDNNIQVIESAIYVNPHHNEPINVVNGYMYTKILQLGLSYGQAVDLAMHHGKRAARVMWKGYWELGTLSHPKSPTSGGSTKLLVAVLRSGEGVAPATPYTADLFATDWMIVE